MKNWQKLKQELEPYNGSKTHYAGDVLRFCKLPSDRAICINSILYNLEIELTHDCDKIVLLKNNPITIHVGKNLKTEQWRFATAHALGHLFLHESKEYSCNNMAHPNFLEKEANDFACNLLAPLYMIEPIVSYSKIKVNDIANDLGIHINVLNIQLQKLLGCCWGINKKMSSV